MSYSFAGRPHRTPGVDRAQAALIAGLEPGTIDGFPEPLCTIYPELASPRVLELLDGFVAVRGGTTD